MDDAADPAAGARSRRPLVLALFVLAIALRLLVLPLQTSDVDDYLVPWQRHADAVGLGYLRAPFTNYAPFYEHCLAFTALFPGSEALRVKLFSIVFDFAMAGVVARLVPAPRRALAFCAALLLPTVIHNGALSGQSDAIYTTFLLLALLAAVRRRPVWTMLAFAAALAVKFQSIMFAPVLALLFLERRQPLWTVVLLPIPYLLFGLPMLLAGRTLPELFLVYGRQFGNSDLLANGAPNPWLIAKFLVDYRTGVMIGLPLAAAITGGLVLWLWRAGVARSREGLLLAAAIFLLVAPFVTPKMLDHFFYPAHLVLVALAFTARRYVWPFVLAQFAGTLSYIPFLMVYYGRANPFFGEHSYLQQHYGFGWGIFAAVAVLPMGLAIVLLLREAYRMGRDGGAAASLPVMIAARLRRVPAPVAA